MPEGDTRFILEEQGRYVGRENQILEASGPRGRLHWVNAGGGGDFFDPEPRELEILEKHGSPIIVYPDGRVEKLKD